MELAQSGAPFEGMGVAFEDYGKERGRVFSKPRSWDLGAYSQGVQGKGRTGIGTGSPGRQQGPSPQPPSLSAFYLGVRAGS